MVFCMWGPHASVIWKTIYGGPTCPWDMEKKSSHVSSHASPPYARVVHTDAAMVVPVSWLTRGGEARWWLGLGVEGKGGRQGVCEHGNGIVDRFSREGGGGHDELLPMHVQTTSSSSRTLPANSFPHMCRNRWPLLRRAPWLAIPLRVRAAADC